LCRPLIDSVGDGVAWVPAQFSQPTHNKLAFEHYEQVLMLEEIRPSKDRGELINDLSKKKETAYRVIEFFFAVETRALQYYARPHCSALG
jgi:hypothetical protein